jgi:hypothetical protein
METLDRQTFNLNQIPGNGLIQNNHSQSSYLTDNEKWYLRAYQSEDNRLDRYKKSIPEASHLHCIPFSLIVSVNPSYVSSIERMKSFVHYIQDECEKYHKAPLSGVLTYDTVPNCHVHMALLSSHELSKSWFERYLRLAVGQKNYKIEDFDVNGYQLLYILRVMDRFNQESFQLDFINMELYLGQAQNCRQRRRFRRHQKRMAT